MRKIDQLLRPHLRQLKPYSSARNEFDGKNRVLLDANENPFGDLNRYPDPLQKELKVQLSELYGVNPSQIFLGNGSDEAIDLLFRLFCEPDKDVAMGLFPSYGMYEVSAVIHNVAFAQVSLDRDFDIDVDRVLKERVLQLPKLLFLCTPNNPTGNELSAPRIERLLRTFDGIVVIDEAYADFQNGNSWIDRLAEFPNLVVLRTLSKAHGLAGARIGVALAQPDLVQWLNKIKPPYNISLLNQQAALQALAQPGRFEQEVSLLKKERLRLADALCQFETVVEVYPSDANFLLVEFTNPEKVYQHLLDDGVVVRNRTQQVPGCLRITVGSPEQNDRLLNALKKLTS